MVQMKDENNNIENVNSKLLNGDATAMNTRKHTRNKNEMEFARRACNI